jgi:hypothetical protein
MIIRWISEVPSKIVKILAVGTVSAVQHTVGLEQFEQATSGHVAS